MSMNLHRVYHAHKLQRSLFTPPIITAITMNRLHIVRQLLRLRVIRGALHVNRAAFTIMKHAIPQPHLMPKMRIRASNIRLRFSLLRTLRMARRRALLKSHNNLLNSTLDLPLNLQLASSYQTHRRLDP